MCDQTQNSHNKVIQASAFKQNMRVNCDAHALENFEKCKEWLENCTIHDCSASGCGDCAGNDISTFDESASDSTTDCSSEYSSQLISASTSNKLSTKNFVDSDQLKSIVPESQNVYENIIVNNSKKVHLGNVTVINGPIYIKEAKKSKNTTDGNLIDSKPEHLKLAEAHIRWIDRRAWLSQPPDGEYEKLQQPAKFVIICHSATEDSTTHADNIILVRYIQQFHIECKKWMDIAYNFLIGCDGYTYKGRGWGVRGAHSFRYNRISIGICFVGTFCTKLPTQIALEQAKALIKYGVEQGEIDADYKLIGNCQVSSSKSPGERLFEEIQNWEHFDASVSTENPSELLPNIS